MTIRGASYIAFRHTETQMHNIEKFFCLERDSSVFATDTTFNLYEIWVNDTSYRNKLINPVSGKNLVFLGPVLTNFTKDKVTFGRFVLELLSSNSKLRALKKIFVDLEPDIFEGFKSIIPLSNRSVYLWNLVQSDESKLLKLLQRTGQSLSTR